MNPKLTLLILCALSASALNVLAANKVVTGGTTVESDQTYESIATQAALQVSGSGTLYSGTNLTLSATFDTGNGRFGAYANNFGALNLFGGTITTTGTTGHGVLYGNTIGATSGTLRRVTIVTSGYGAYGVQAQSGLIRLDHLNVTTTGSNAYAVAGINLEIADSAITTSGVRAMGLVANGGSNSLFTARNVSVVTYGAEAYGAVTAGANASGTIELHLTDVRVETFGAAANAVHVGTGTNPGVRIVEIIGGTYQAHRGAGIGINDQPGNQPAAVLQTYGGIYDIRLSGGATVSGTASINFHSARIASDTGAEVDFPTTITLHVENSTLNGAANFKGSSTSMVNFSDHSALNGDLNVSHTAALTLTLDDSTLSGNVTGSGTATATITVSGQDGRLLGDIAQNDDAAVTVIISDGATGSGGYHGGNLITGGDSAWTFDKDSHGNYGENHGTWNLGDYDVTFDNMIHTGTITISVNSDTGEGGSITITDTADGEGTVHINTTGNGQADPNKVLPGIVSGKGTEHWQWDPIDWGIDTIIKDGDHFIKQGTSPAGAVLNSSVAIQQAMWFAQQNSLLKRMGELRYGARASRPLADKDVRVPYHSLIENIWIRSYGQQLNIGSQASGKAYEQLIYGVDLGTDHKFTLSADSDLYLGIYAGYGRSDLDYRTPGTDGEINSYYGGLYATWLHASGFYLDATIKAASVDNDLKAPYGNTQLKASYSDVNLGGSIEIGHKFTFADDWFIEPQFQVNYLHILAEDYTAGPMSLKAQDLDALQLRIGSLFGRTINLTNSGALQPYVKISGVETISSGGAIRNGYQSTRANTDGARAELGGGLIWQLDADNQLHLDYEASFGDKYDKPWGLSAGYRHQF